MRLQIDTYDETGGYWYANPAEAKIGNEITCLFYLIGEDDKKSEAFAKYLISKLCKDIKKYIPYDNQSHAYVLKLKQGYNYSDLIFTYTPKGIFRLGYLTIEAEPYKNPCIETEETIQTTKPSKTQLDKMTEFPFLQFNWGLHAQIAMHAGHSAKLSHTGQNIKLSKLLKDDAEDRLIAKNLDIPEMIKNRIMDRLKTIIETYTGSDISKFPYYMTLYGSDHFNKMSDSTMINLTSCNIIEMAEQMKKLFGESYINHDSCICDVNNNSILSGQHQLKTLVLGTKAAKQTTYDKTEYQLLFLNNDKTAAALAAKLTEINKLMTYSDKTSYASQSVHAQVLEKTSIHMQLQYGMMMDDIRSCLKNGVNPEDIYVRNFNMLSTDKKFIDKISRPYIRELLENAIARLPENIYDEFNNLMKHSEHAKNMRLVGITIAEPENSNGERRSPRVQLSFTGVPRRIWKIKQGTNNEGQWMTEEQDQQIDLTIRYEDMTQPDEPYRQQLIDNMIDLYRILYSIDNPFIRGTLKRLGLIKEGFQPAKYSEEQSTAKDTPAA